MGFTNDVLYYLDVGGGGFGEVIGLGIGGVLDEKVVFVMSLLGAAT